MNRIFPAYAALALCLISPLAAPGAGAPVSTPNALWEFNNSANIAQATIGPALTIEGTAPGFSATAADDGGTSLTGVITTVGGTGNRLRAVHGIPGNGGGTFLNEYSILFDVFTPSSSRSSWRCLFQTNPNNSNDGDYFIRNSNDTMGTAELGYTGSGLNETRWKRVIVVADNPSFFKVYVDGVLFHTHSARPIDGRYGLESALLLFCDDSGENASIRCGAVAMWGKVLSEAEILGLGVAGAAIQGATLPNNAPVITQGAAVSLPVQQDVSAGLTLNVTDADNDTITWDISGAATNGVANVAASGNTQATINYTPAAGYIGADSFTVRASDGAASDTIVVNVTVQGSIVTITEGASASLLAPKDSGPQSITFHATDSNNNPITWSISTAAQNGAAQITGNNNQTGVITYTPNNGFVGSDSFTVRAASGSSFDEIVVAVQVAFSSGNPKQFYSENFNNAILRAEVTTSGERRMPAGDNTPVWNTPDAAGLNLANGNNVFLNPANDRIAEFTGFNLLRSDFWSNGDDQSRSTAFARGTNVIAVADSDEYTDGGGTGGTGDEAEFNVFLRTPPFIIPAGANVSQMTLRFLSSFRIEEDETSKVRVFINGNSTPAAVLNVPDNGANPAALLSYSWAQIGSPPAGSVMMLEFGHEDADNNWWWAMDDIAVGIPNQVPLIAEGATAALNAQMNSTSTLTLNVSDADGDDIAWTISGAAAHGSAQITTSGNTQATISYTPALNYTGADTFTVRASDGPDSDSIVISVSVVNGAPLISEGESYNLSATKNGGAREVTFHATDPNGNALVWSIPTAAAHGAAAITASSSSEATVAYTPAADYSGPDSFVVNVTDGALSDSITVNVSVTDPLANPTLTVIAPHGTATPAPGVHSHPKGTALTNSVTDELGATTRHVCTGWTMIGDGPTSGTGNTFDMTLTRDSVLTWTFLTEHRVETAASAGGSVSVGSGWYEAGRPLQITAIPASGKYFAGWTGDTAGCQIGGKSIVVPMDRARSTITADFADSENFTIIALPDTQNYTSIASPSDLYTRQTQWINDNTQTLNIKFVTHLGDIVNTPSSQSEWLRATNAMNLMNNRMAYGTCPGNHDIASGDTNYIIRFGPNPTHSSSIGRWIDPDTTQTYDWYRGASPRGYSSYQVVTVNGRDYMFLHLDMDCPDQDMAWAAGVLNAHPKALTMVTTHNYLAETGGGGTYGSGTGQRGYTANVNTSVGPDRNRPVEVFNALVKPYRQVYMVICGHNFATYNLVKTNDAGKAVHEVLVDWQSLPNGGNAFLRIMEYRPQQNLIYNTSYSPYLGRYVDPNNNADHQGMLDLHDRNGSEFSLATDFDTRFNTSLTVVSPHGGVSPAVGTHQVEDGTPVAITAQVRVEGQSRYRPTGWTLTGSQTSSGVGGSSVITHNGPATLQWNYATEHFLTTATVGAGIVSTSSGWYAAGTVVNIQAQPDDGADFVRWSGDISGCTITGGSIAVPMDRPRGPVTAEFTSPLPTFAVAVVSAYPNVSPAPATYTYEQGQQVTFTATDILGADTRRVCTGYAVTGAVTQSGPEKSVTLAITGNMTITWQWRTEYLLTTAANGPGAVSPNGEQWINEGAPISITATPSPGASFTGWTGDIAAGSSSANVFTISSMSRPAGPLTANFMTGVHTLTVVSSQPTVTPSAGTHTVAFGATVDFSAYPNETGGSRQRPSGWVLSGASTSSASATSGSFVVGGDTTLTWSWVPEVLLSITGGAEGVVMPMNAAGWHAHGATVALQALPHSWFGFRQWTGDVPTGSTNAGLDLVMDQPRSVTPDFAPFMTTDGTPNWWLSRHTSVTAFNYEAARANDSDFDGRPAWQEFVEGMSDLDPLLRYHIHRVAVSEDGANLLFNTPMAAHRVYQILEGASPAGAFLPVGSPLAGMPPAGVASIPLPSGSPRFYSMKVALGAVGARDADPVARSHSPVAGAVMRPMVKVPTGAFIQGENTGPLTTRPEHTTHVAAFHIDKFEVTRADWEAVATWARTSGYDIPITLKYNQPPYNVPADHPAVAVSWFDAAKWCNARSEMEGRRPVYFADSNGTTVYRTGEIDLTSAQVNWSGDGYRLPTEAEWERAARGGIDQAIFPWGDEPGETRANHWDYQLINGRAPNQPYPYTERVGFFDGTQTGGAPDMANGFGLYDMVGNAWEWTWDRMGDYSPDSQYDPRGPDAGTVQRVQRGGSWWNYVDQSTNYQRLPFPPDGSDDYGMIGFRCVRAAHPNE